MSTINHSCKSRRNMNKVNPAEKVNLQNISKTLQSISSQIEDLQDEHPLEAEYLRMRLLDLEYRIIISTKN